MNVIQMKERFKPAGEQNENRLSREQPDLSPPILPKSKRYLDSNLRKEQRTNWKSTSQAATLLTTSASRNYISRSGTKSNTGAGSSALESASGIVLAITTGRGEARSEVGIAALNIRCPHLILCQISDSQTYISTLSKLYLFDPIEILMPDTMCERVAGKGILYRSILDKFLGVEVTPISRVHFNDALGLDRVRSLCVAECSSIELYVKQKYYALAAAAALLKYVEYTRRLIYMAKSMKVEFQGSPNATTIDLESARSLELVQSECGQRNVSLLGVLDRCSTPMGRKLLRANILQPPCDERIVLERQSAVAEMASNRSLRALVQSVVRRLYGADRLLSLATTPVFQENNVQCAEQNLNYVLLLKNLLDVVPELGGILSVGQSDLLRRIRQRLDNHEFRAMRRRILDTIHPDASSVAGYTSSNMQRCFAIKAGINDLLDIARQTYCELIDDMKVMVENLSSKYKLSLSLSCNASLGYHAQAILPRSVNPNTNFELPSEFIQVRKNRRVYTMTTSALATLSQQCKIACEELHLMSNVLLCDLLQTVRGHIGCLFQLSADVAELDLITSLARVSALQMYTRPTFGPKLQLHDSRHPIMEAFGVDVPVPNHVNASIPRNFSLISGPNMSGKSTYLKQIVLLHVMAQIGCFVPAKKATFRLTDFIFCKIAVRDDIECNASTFTLEMKEAQYVLRSVTPTSLIVFDELCRGTAIKEGASIAWAICEQLLNTTAFTFAATHFSYLTKLADFYYNVTNYHFQAIHVREAEGGSSCRFTYTHRLKFGVAPSNDYGIVLAELSGLPKPVTEKARKYASDEELMVDRVTTKSNSWENTCYELIVKIYELLEADSFDRERVTRLLVESFLNSRKQRSDTNTKQEERTAHEIENDQHHEEMSNEDNFFRKFVTETVDSERNMDVTNERMRESRVTRLDNVNVGFNSFASFASSASSASSAIRKNETANLKDNPFDLLNEEYHPPSDRSLYSMKNPSSFYSMITENNARSNQPDKHPSVSSKIIANSIRSATPETDLSSPIIHQSFSTRASLSIDRPVSGLYEYYLSDHDLEPFSVSRFTSIALSADSQSTDLLTR